MSMATTIHHMARRPLEDFRSRTSSLAQSAQDDALQRLFVALFVVF